jgi:hypothetical protein
MKIKFEVEINYQPINNQYGALIKHGNTTVFEVNEVAYKAVLDCLSRFISGYFKEKNEK